jgi:hypothetical protein
MHHWSHRSHLGQALNRMVDDYELSGVTLRLRSFLFCLLLGVMVVGSLNVGYSQFMCHIANLRIDHPESVQAGLTLQVTSTLTASCDPNAFYLVRVDLVDASTSSVLSTVSNPYYPTSSSFTTTLVNEASARMATGSWALKVEAYVINGASGQVVASTSELFTVNVAPYSPPTTTVQTGTTTSTFSTSFSTPGTTSVAASQEVATTETYSTSPQQLIEPGVLLPVTAVILVALAIVLAIMITRRKNGEKQRKIPTMPSRFCISCGKKIQANARFCGHCGAEQS